jgi:hypothetical protein
MKDIKQLVKDTPNDAELGKLIRELYEPLTSITYLNYICENCKHNGTQICNGCKAPYE